MFEKPDKRRRNVLTGIRLMAVAGFILIIISRFTWPPERDVYRMIGITLVIGFVIARVFLAIRPGAFGPKSANPDEGAD